MGYRTIEVGTDGSITALAAQQAAARMAKRFRSELVLVTAYDPPRISRTMAEGVLARAQQAVRRDRVEADGEAGRAEPAELILAVAARRQADLIVVGNKNIGQATRLRLGSIPDRIAHGANCDVLVVNTTRFGRSGPGPRSDKPYMRILAGTDGSATASEASRKAFELALLL